MIQGSKILTHLSENNIKRIALGFLKTYYKFRPRGEGETIARYDVQTADGIIADGYLSYPLENGTDFIVTFEATSYDTHEEVVYKLQDRLLNWDCAAAAGLFTAFSFSFGLAKGYFSIRDFGLIGLLGLLLGIGILAFYFLRLFLAMMQRYRYIYAIEQFKRYHADEQWIAIAEDVFNGPNDRYLKELKHQCIYNGFGLLAVDRDGQAQMLITPSRQEVFGESRKNLDLFNRDIAFKENKWQTFLRKINNGISKVLPKRSKASLNRYRKSNYKQLTLLLIALGIIGGVFIRELDNRMVVYADESDYEKNLLKKSKELTKESKGYLLDTARMVPHGSETSSYLGHEIELEADDNDGRRQQFELIETDVLEFEAAPERHSEIIVAAGDREHQSYNCARFYNFEGTVYLVQDSAYPTMSSVQQRMDKLNRMGLETSSLWLGCFSKTEQDYVIYYNLLYDNKTSAMEALEAYRSLLKKKKLRSGKVAIRSLRKK